ncbi:MAG: response regulator [Anaerolineales bacterium]
MTHILVIEDDPSIQMIVRKTLTKVGGFTVTVTEEVTVALTLARSGSVALIVMDVSLKNTRYEGRYIDGLAFARLLKSDPATHHIPILLATAHARPGDAEKLSRACGADGYIAKPFAEPKMLVDHIRQMLDKRKSNARS